MTSFYQLFLSNLRIFYRNRQGFYWTIIMPAVIYIALSLLPIGKFISSGTNYSNFVLPGVIAMTIMQTGVYGLAYWMVDLKSRGVLKRFLVTPISPMAIILGIVASRLVVIIVETIALTLIGVLLFHASFAWNVLSSLIITIIGGGIFLLLGLLISNYANSYEAAAPITSAVGLPLALLGNIFYPLDLLPPVLQTLAKLLPITYLADGLRQTYLYPFSFEKVSTDIIVLAVWFVILLLITLSVFKLKEE